MSDWLALAASDAPPLLWVVLDAAFKGCVLLALAGAGVVALRYHSAAAMHAVWMSALLGLLALPVLSAALPRWRPTLPATHAPQVTALAEIIPAPASSAPAEPAQVVDPRAWTLRRSPRPLVAIPTPVPPAAALRWVPPAQATRWALRVWGAGVAIGLVVPVLGLASLARLARSSKPVTEPAQLRLLEQLRKEIGIGRDVRLLQSDRRVIPMTWGILRPTLLLPDGVGAWPEEVLRVVLLHELAHVRRWDCLTQLLGRLACALYWFNPLAWLALAQARGEQERACDDCVLNSGSDPSDYAEQLLMIASGRRSGFLGASVALAMSASSPIERRLRAILDPKRPRRPFSSGRLRLAAAVALGCTAALASFSLHPAAAAPPPPEIAARPESKPSENEADLKDPAEVLAAVRAHYIKDTDESVLRHGAIKGLVDALHDPYSQYLDPKQAAGLTRQIQGSLTGIGAMLEMKGGRPAVRGTLPDSPAFKAGLKAGDVIVEVDGKSTEGLEISESVRRIIGAPGTPVSLTVEAAEGNRKTITITRAAIQIESVQGFARDEHRRWNYLLDSKHRIGYAHVDQFSPTTHQELKAALEALKGQDVQGLILDLRDCPGGLLDAAVSCVKLFLAKGKILSIRGRGEPERTIEADGNALRDDLPLVVLINGQTASAGEIVSGALKDNGRAVLVGSRTFGKGSVQSIITLKDDQGLIKLTTAYYYLPSGRNIERVAGRDDWGVDPTDGDVVPDDPKLREARRRRVEGGGVVGGDPNPATVVTPERLAAAEFDPQLAAALKALIAKTTEGTFVKVGQSVGNPLAHDDRLDAVQKRREALLEDLKRVDRELEDLKAKSVR